MKYLFLLHLFFALVFSIPKQAQAQSKQIVVCIDPGHGGADSGNLPTGKGMKLEKELNLSIAKKLGHYIDSLIENVTVIYTRTEDVSMSLDDRVALANQKKVDYFISIHCNSNGKKQVYGTQTHIHSHNFEASRELALRIEKEFGTRGARKSRGVMAADDRRENLFVLQYTDMPAVLIETGFMSNKKEERYLNTTYGQEILASAIFRSFRDFIQTKHKVGNRDTVYKVQIGVSKTPLKSLGYDQKFKKLRLRVVEHQGTGAYKYRYMVGREYDKASANKLLEKIKKAGIKDAYIVNMTNKESKKHRVVE